MVLCLFTCHFSFARSPIDSVGISKINGRLHIKYLVTPGETIYGISTRYKVAITDLMEINPELEQGLKVGQVINIPYFDTKDQQSSIKIANEVTSSKEAAPVKLKENNKVIHKVQAGETLYSLARRYNVSVNDLMKWNNLELKVGQEVVVSPGSQNVANDDVATKGNIVTVRPAEKTDTDSKSSSFGEIKDVYEIDSTRKQVLVIPFDPYLYFSDADDEIAARSNINRTKIRQVFRRRLNALLDHPGYENIYLLGGKAIDSISDLNKIYSSVTYNYQDILYSPNYLNKQKQMQENQPYYAKKNTAKEWIQKQKEKISPEEATSKASVAKDNGKYFGVKVKNQEFYNYFNQKYDVDYYIFVNQFEVKTNYEHCLDRAAQNYERTFTTHYSIFNSEGKQISGNRINTHYNSNSNNIEQILADNMQKIADRILDDLPAASKQK